MIPVQLTNEDWLTKEREVVAAKIALGFAQWERGEVLDGDAAIEILRECRRDQDLRQK